MNYCDHRGLLVSADLPVPEDLSEFYLEGMVVTVGCNRLWCGACQSWVRNVAGLRLSDETKVSDIFDVADLGTLDCFEEDSLVRTYFCRCSCWIQSVPVQVVGSCDPHGKRSPLCWRCFGHPEAHLPIVLDGEVISESDDIEAKVRAVLAGHVPQGARPEEKSPPSGWVVKLYARLLGLPLAERVALAVSKSLLDRSCEIRKAAIDFYSCLPLAPGAEMLEEVLHDTRELFLAYPDPERGRELYARLLVALGRRAERQVSWKRRYGMPMSALETLEMEALRPGHGGELYMPILKLDPEYLMEYLDKIITTSPGSAEQLLLDAGTVANSEDSRLPWSKVEQIGLCLARTPGVDRDRLRSLVKAQGSWGETRDRLLLALDNPVLDAYVNGRGRHPKVQDFLNDLRDTLRGFERGVFREARPGDGSHLPPDALLERYCRTPGLAQEVADGCAVLLFDPDVAVRTGAVRFFQRFPDADDHDALVTAFYGARLMFDTRVCDWLYARGLLHLWKELVHALALRVERHPDLVVRYSDLPTRIQEEGLGLGLATRSGPWQSEDGL